MACTTFGARQVPRVVLEDVEREADRRDVERALVRAVTGDHLAERRVGAGDLDGSCDHRCDDGRDVARLRHVQQCRRRQEIRTDSAGHRFRRISIRASYCSCGMSTFFCYLTQYDYFNVYILYIDSQRIKMYSIVC